MWRVRRARHSELTALAGWSRTALGPDACRALAAGLAGEVAGEPPGAGGREPTVVVVDDAELLTEGPCDAALRALARLGRDAPLRLVAAVGGGAPRPGREWPVGGGGGRPRPPP